MKPRSEYIPDSMELYEYFLFFYSFQKIVDEWKDMNARIGVLEGDSSNIVELIRKTYSVSVFHIKIRFDS